MNNVLLVQERELSVVGALMKAKQYCGFPYKTQTPKKKEMIQIIHKLWKSGIISEDGGKVGVSEKYKDVFNDVFAATHVVEIKKDEKILCCYPGKNMTLIEPSCVKHGELLVTQINENKLVTYLEEGDYIPQIKEREFENAEESYILSRNTEDVLKIKIIKADDGKTVEDIRIKLEGLRYFITNKNALYGGVEKYSKKELRLTLEKCIKQYKNIKDGV